VPFSREREKKNVIGTAITMKCICFADLDLAYYPKRKDRAAELQEFDVLLLIHFGDLVFLRYRFAIPGNFSR